MFSGMLTAAFQDGDNGIPIRHRFDGKLVNKKVEAKSKVQTQVLDGFLFADGMAKGIPTEEKMQKGVDLTPLTAMTSQSASKRQRWFINQHLESLTRSPPLQWKVKDCKW